MIRLSKASRATLTATGILLCGIALTGCGNSTAQPSGSSPASSSGTSSASASATDSASSADASDAPSSDTKSTVGALIQDFPKTLLPLMPGAEVKLSVVDKSTNPATASLVGSTSSSSKDIVDFYTKALQAQGFTLLPGGNVGSVVSKDFVRKDGKENINLSISSDNGTNTFTLGASVEAASLK
ncbi:hypothetical protein [Psychromicrobium sp. YIM B11713]|uniref:hypothetical protein n=1 Tax=Psychromicrobium sp. YIM B11713 TaxID=3145233 RepID=UPI00374EB778